MAFQVYDSVRRPRANRVVSTSEEAGLIYCQHHSETGADMDKIVANGNARVPWIWAHDLNADVEVAKATFGNMNGKFLSPVSLSGC
jgi:salicylate hydroxylase